MVIELARHIESLLLENDCVIIPGFGGFIVQYVPARQIEDEGIFSPPCRVVGFNSQLCLNDGLLIQSYMQTHDVNYPEASRLVDEAVSELRRLLSENGEIIIYGVGRLSLNIENIVTFCPNEDGIHSPSLYGLGSFEIFELSKELPETRSLFVEKPVKHSTLIIHINKSWLNSAVGIVAAVLLFFFLSVPVDNTYIEPESYASLNSVGLFDCIRSQSVATSLVKVVEKDGDSDPICKSIVTNVSSMTKDNNIEYSLDEKFHNHVLTSTLSDTEKKEKEFVENVEAHSGEEEIGNRSELQTLLKDEKENLYSISKDSIRKATTHYYIIIASVTNIADAEETIDYFAKKGYPGGMVVEGDGRVRVAISSFVDRKEADAEWGHLRKIELFQNAWILALSDK